MDSRFTGDKFARVLVVAFALLLINSSYLSAYASPTLFYFVNIAFHILFGGAAVFVFAAYALKTFRTASRPFRLAGLLLLAGGAVGAYLTKVGTTRPHRLALQVHVALAVAGSIVMLAILL